jgi:phosphatidylinositol 4-kinase
LLGIHSPPGEFKTLLKVYSKLAHDALVKDDAAILEAVSARQTGHEFFC